MATTLSHSCSLVPAAVCLVQASHRPRAAVVRCSLDSTRSRQHQRDVHSLQPETLKFHHRAVQGGLIGLAALVLQTQGASAGWFELPAVPSVDLPAALAERAEQANKKFAADEEAFQNSDILKTLRERSAQNKDRYRKEIEEKYCARQGELGVGDCGGLRYIPGATKSGKQKTPGWLNQLLGNKEEETATPAIVFSPNKKAAAPEPATGEDAAPETAAAQALVEEPSAATSGDEPAASALGEE